MKITLKLFTHGSGGKLPIRALVSDDIGTMPDRFSGTFEPQTVHEQFVAESDDEMTIFYGGGEYKRKLPVARKDRLTFEVYR